MMIQTMKGESLREKQCVLLLDEKSNQSVVLTVVAMSPGAATWFGCCPIGATCVILLRSVVKRRWRFGTSFED